MTLLVASIGSASVEQVAADIDAAVEQGADAIELRIDLMRDVPADQIASLRPRAAGRPIIVTLRSEAEGGAWDGDDEQRLETLLTYAPIADYVDVELDWWRKAPDARQRIAAALRRAGQISQTGGVEQIELAQRRRLILSRHDPATRPATLQADLLAMLDEPLCEVPKIAWRARSVRDNFEAFELMRESAKPLIAICMGDDGQASRILAPKFGAFGTFAAIAAGRETAQGQLTLSDFKSIYRWNTLGRKTQVYGLIGHPIGHSISPHVHNAAFNAAGMDAVYVPFPVRPGYESFKAFMVEVMARPWLDFRGASVTIPHKENALRFIDEAGGSVDAEARRIGAVNTISLDADGVIRGINTDAPAIIDALCICFDCDASALAGRSVLILGARGSARAAAAACSASGMRVTIANRTPARAAELAAALGAGAAAWESRGRLSADAVVNCTSVGMWPDVEASPMEPDSLSKDTVAVDLVYNPLRTKFLADALDRGCRTVDGLTVFLNQAAAQFGTWTGQAPAMGVLRSAAEAALRRFE